MRPRDQQWHLATYAMSTSDLDRRGIHLDPDHPRPRILRSVLMKPEHEQVVDELVEVLAEVSARTVSP